MYMTMFKQIDNRIVCLYYDNLNILNVEINLPTSVEKIDKISW